MQQILPNRMNFSGSTGEFDQVNCPSATIARILLGDSLSRGSAPDVAVCPGRGGSRRRKGRCSGSKGEHITEGDTREVGTKLIVHDHFRDRFPLPFRPREAFNSVFCPRFRMSRMSRTPGTPIHREPDVRHHRVADLHRFVQDSRNSNHGPRFHPSLNASISKPVRASSVNQLPTPTLPGFPLFCYHPATTAEICRPGRSQIRRCRVLVVLGCMQWTRLYLGRHGTV